MKTLRTPVLIGSLTLGLALTSAPAVAAPTTPPAPTPATKAGSARSASLEDAVRKDLKMPLEEFNRLGGLAADAVPLQEKLGRDGIVVLSGGKLVTRGGKAPMSVSATTARSQGFANLEQLRKAYLDQVGPEGLTSIGYTEKGYDIAVHEPEKARDRKAGVKSSTFVSPKAWGAQFPGVTVSPSQQPGKATATRTDAGQAVHGAGSTCSLGFSAYDAGGVPVKMSAGHCGFIMRGANLYTAGQYLGKYRWYQYGAPGNAYESYGTDLAFIGPLNTRKFEHLPVVMNYRGGRADVTGVGTAVVGMPVCRSGRTTGWSCGKIYKVGWDWVNIGTTDFSKPKHWVWSAFSIMTVIEGDSGGPWISGRNAVGINSAYGWDYAGAPRHATAALVTDLTKYRRGSEIKILMQSPIVVGARSRGGRLRLTTKKPVEMMVGVLRGDKLPPRTVVKVKLPTRRTPYTLDRSPRGRYWLKQLPPKGKTWTISAWSATGYSSSAPTILTLTNG